MVQQNHSNSCNSNKEQQIVEIPVTRSWRAHQTEFLGFVIQPYRLVLVFATLH